MGDRIAALDKRVAEADSALESVLLRIPNLPHPTVPTGKRFSSREQRKRERFPGTRR